MLGIIKRIARRKGNTTRLYPVSPTQDVGWNGHRASNDAALNDVSYEEAILDTELRLFFYTEYAGFEPPDGAFERVLAQVDEGNRVPLPLSVRLSAALRATFSGLYRALNAQPVGRLVPGAIAMLLFFTVLGSNAGRFFHPEARFIAPSSVNTPVPAHHFDRTPSDVVREPLVVPARSEQNDSYVSDPYDPAAYRTMPGAPALKKHLVEEVAPEQVDTPNSKFGPL